jgi:hypothetical protein
MKNERVKLTHVWFFIYRQVPYPCTYWFQKFYINIFIIKIFLMFDNWINSDLIYINDILNENGEISQNLILDKLKYKNNWISEFICLKKAIQNVIAFLFDPHPFLSRFAIFLYKNQEYILNNL